MSPHAVRLMLTALVIAAIAALLPASALANVTSTLTLSEPGGTAAGSTTSLGLDAQFSASAGDAVKDMSIDLPPGLLIDESIDGGLCLAATAPTPACAIATGTVTIAGAVTPATLYLEHAAGIDDLAGVQLVAGSVSVLGSLSLNSSLDVGVSPSLYTATHLNFSGLSSVAISNLTFTLTGVRLPSSCVSDPAAAVSVWTDSALNPSPVLASAGLPVTGCGALAYTPTIISSVTLSPHSRRATLVTTIVQPAGQSATEKMKVSLAPGLVPSKRLAPCVQGAPCVIGTASLTSPLLGPGALSNGTMTLGGTQSSPTLTITFLEPTPLVLSGTLVPANGQLTLDNLPDIPLTSMQLRFTGTATGGPVLTADLANCHPAQFHATLFPISGSQAAGVAATAVYQGCPPRQHRGINRPSASVSLTGIAAGHPRLSVAVQSGTKAPPIRSVWIDLPPGLNFSPGAQRGAATPGAGIKRERVLHGKLFVTFDHPVSRSTFRVASPLLTAGRALRRRVRGGSAAPLKLIVGLLDTIGDRPTVGLLVKPR